MDKYSKKEQELFHGLGLDYYLRIQEWPAPIAYKAAAELMFINNTQGLAVDSLRRCIKAMLDCKIYRNTPEWDELIKLED